MPVWSEDFSASRLEEVLQRQAQNRAWGKELRLRSSALVNSRLAKQISQADYTLDRQRVNEETVECRRRAAILEVQIERRMKTLPLGESTTVS